MDADDETHSVVLNAFRGIICFVGVIGNLIVIFVIITLREYKNTVTHWYILQLALANICFLLTLPFQIVENIEDKWIWSNGMCKTKQAMIYINYYSSVLLLSVMSIDRFIAVCYGFSTNLKKLRSKQASWFITAVIWIVSVVSCTPILIYSKKIGCQCRFGFHDPNMNKSGTEEFDLDTAEAGDSCDDEFSGDFLDYSGKGYSGEPSSGSGNEPEFAMGCSYGAVPRGFLAYIYFNFIVMFLIPCIVMSICFFMIVVRLRKSQTVRRQTDERSTISESSVISERKRILSVASIKEEKSRFLVSVVCLSIVSLFVICWLPFHSVHLAKINGINESTEVCTRLFLFTSLLVFLNAAMNPYIYNFIGKGFGERLRSASYRVRATVRRGSEKFHSNTVILKYKSGRKSSTSTNSNSATVTTKIYNKRKNEASSSQLSSKDQEQKSIVKEIHAED